MLWVILLEKKNYLCQKRDGIRCFDGTGTGIRCFDGTGTVHYLRNPSCRHLQDLSYCLHKKQLPYPIPSSRPTATLA